MSEYNDLNESYRTNHYDPLQFAKFGRVGNNETGQGYGRVQNTDQTVRFDEGATYTYIGLSYPGAITSSAVWKVIRITNASNTVLFADGNPFYDNIYDNRTSLTYS